MKDAPCNMYIREKMEAKPWPNKSLVGYEMDMSVGQGRVILQRGFLSAAEGEMGHAANMRGKKG